MTAFCHRYALSGSALVCGFLLATAVAAVEIPFSAEMTIDGSFNGAGAATAVDLDGDGDLDLLSAASFGSQIAWWVNTAGDGSAWTKRNINASVDGARSATAADLDGDGDLDVLVAATIDNTLTWWENTAGDGTSWTGHTIVEFFGDACSVAVGDMDEDGDLDVIGTARLNDDVSWFENTAGDGSAWTEHLIETSFDGAQAAVMADMDGDGDLDALGAANIDDDIAWFENTAGDGSAWTEHTIDASFNGAQAVVAADVDGDGDLDAVAAAALADDVTWWENTAGDGTAWTEHTLDASFDGAYSVQTADVDEDGDLDVLATADEADEVTWFENTAGDGSAWTERTVGTGFDGARAATFADVDSDGDLDVFAAAFDEDDLAWWRNETIHRSALFETAAPTLAGFMFGADAVEATDLDADGDLDMLAAGRNALIWTENTAGDGSTWAEHMIDPDFDDADSAVAADLDHDGDLDVIGAASDDDQFAWWENTAGDASAWTKHSIADTGVEGADWVRAADLDGDGDLDIAGLTHDALVWCENSAGDASAWTLHVIVTGLGIPFSAIPTDVDGDGDLDLVVSASNDDAIFWWENTAGDASTWFQNVIESNASSPRRLDVADIDGDGDLDVLGPMSTLAAIAWWENTAGDGSAWTRHEIDDNYTDISAAVAEDLDGDGDLDVLAGAQTNPPATWWENSAGSWIRHPLPPAGSDGRAVRAADIDGDGDLDVLAATGPGGVDVSWWQNRGGQFALPTSDLAAARTSDGESLATLEIEATHLGRAGDSDAELATLELLLTDAATTPLTDSQADALLAELAVYLDDGDGSFDTGLDTEVTFVTAFPLTAGVLTVAFADGDANVQLAHGTPRTYFVVADFEADASQQTPDDLRISHLTEASSTGEDAASDIPITLEYAENTASTAMEVNDLPVAQPDAVSVIEGLTLAGDVSADNGSGIDSDEEGDPMTFSLVDPPTLGTLVSGLGSDGTFTYESSMAGVDTFTYRSNDGFGDSGLATVTITIEPSLFADGFESGNTSAWASTVP